MMFTRNSYRDVGTSIVLAVTTFVVYIQVWHHPFINFDDPRYVSQNPHIQSGLSLDGFRWAFSSTYASNWHPLTWLSHMLDIQLYGLNAGGHHMTNVLLHIGSTILLFWMFHRFTGHYFQSSIMAALFALHPLHVESVAWISERKDVLSTFLLMLVLWHYSKYVEKPSLANYLTSLILYFLGLMSKPMLVTVPFLMLLLDYWPFKRIQAGRTANADRSVWIRSILHLIWEKIPFLVLAGVISVITFLVQQTTAVQSLRMLPLSTRLANALVSYLGYIAKMFFPHNLAIVYPYAAAFNGWVVGAAGVILIIIFIIGFMTHRHYPYVIVGWLWYVVSLIPVIGLIQVGSQAMADRYTYIPLIGLFIMITWGACDSARKWSFNQYMVPVVFLMILFILTAITWKQIGLWQDNFSLFEHAIAVTKDNYLAQENLGNAYYEQKRYGEAINHYSEAVKIAPGYAKARNNLGGALLKQGSITAAIEQFHHSLDLVPQAGTLCNLGKAFARKGDMKKAVSHFLQATHLDPGNTDAYVNLGLAYSGFGDYEQARLYFQEALRLQPKNVPALINLGLVLSKQGHFEESQLHLTTALEIDSQNSDIYTQLGDISGKQGKYSEALAYYSKAVLLNPHDFENLANMGTCYFTLKDLDQAVRYYHEALKINPRSSEVNYNLGLVMLEQGKIESARSFLSTALEIKPDFVGARNLLQELRQNSNLESGQEIHSTAP
ncbi:tetratricopeptide repeat protein [candidate division CSSED10-310 bacterium]|uniref:Tetratricopeptide repeat protein n=1 Tax=candidate division CSSED10-310 bacterium TaxID=2855610 RepID=A0ABV6YZ95_UNCC1